MRLWYGSSRHCPARRWVFRAPQIYDGHVDSSSDLLFGSEGFGSGPDQASRQPFFYHNYEKISIVIKRAKGRIE